MEAHEVFTILKRHVSPGAALSAKFMGSDAVETSSDGATIRLSDGRELIDFGSYAVALLGHRYPAVIDAVVRQLGAIPTSTRALANPAVAALIVALTTRSEDRLQHVWLGSDGADVVELAIKLARRVSERPRVLAVEGAFHGKTLGALALTSGPTFRAGLDTLLAHVSHVKRDDGTAVAREVSRGDVAALIIEPIQGEGGVRPLDPDVLRQWASDARAAGAFVISDEIQVGLTRCGPFSLATEFGLRPDAVLFGKALGGGILPLAAMLATEQLHQPLIADPTWHSSTFGGHPLSCAAGTASLESLDALADRRTELSGQIEAELRNLTTLHAGTIVDLRGRGLLWGIELRTASQAGHLLLELASRGLLVSPCMSSPTTIRLMPPITTTDEQMERAIRCLSDGLEAIRKDDLG
jgi:putrescine aminotransferase